MPKPNKLPVIQELEPRIKITARVSLAAYDAIAETQRRHRTQTGRVLPLWKVLDAALIAHAKTEGITTKPSK